MKRSLLFGLLVAAVCTPLLFVAFLLTAANVPAMDKLTLALPQSIRSAVAQLAVASRGATGKKEHERIFKLDPTNFALNERRQSVAMSADPGAAVKLNKLGLDQESTGDPCTAEDTFTEANSKANGGNTEYLRNMGRAAYECGRYAYSVSEFSAAEDYDARAQLDDPEDSDDLNSSLNYEREWLSLAYTATKQSQLANDACLRAHSNWKACRCSLKENKPSCVESARPTR